MITKETAIRIRVEKREKKDWSRAAKKTGVSLSEYIRRAVKEKLNGN